MEPSEVRAALAAAALTVPDLRAFDYLPDSIDPPAFIAGEVTINYDQVNEGGFDEHLVTCHLYASSTDSKRGQKLLDGFLSPAGPNSVKAALEADRTLGGIAVSLTVFRVTGYGKYRASSVSELQFYGAKLDVRVWGL